MTDILYGSARIGEVCEMRIESHGKTVYDGPGLVTKMPRNNNRQLSALVRIDERANAYEFYIKDSSNAQDGTLRISNAKQIPLNDLEAAALTTLRVRGL